MKKSFKFVGGEGFKKMFDFGLIFLKKSLLFIIIIKKYLKFVGGITAHTDDPPNHPFIVWLNFSDADIAYVGGKPLNFITKFLYFIIITKKMYLILEILLKFINF